jgi:adenylate kinase family enzyme
MKKIIVIGCPGSGKSTFARALHEKTGIPLHHLDMMYWNANKTTVEKSIFLERVSNVLQKDHWILDGNYSGTMEMRMAACDTVFFLDYPVDVCLDGIRARRGKPRSDMPWVETEEDAEFIEFVKSFQEQQRPKILERLESFGLKNLFIFQNREQADEFLRNVNCESDKSYFI